jgi:hypothetical protein
MEHTMKAMTFNEVMKAQGELPLGDLVQDISKGILALGEDTPPATDMVKMT